MLQALVEAALQGQDQRLVARCDVGGIVAAFEDFGVYDPDTLRSTLQPRCPSCSWRSVARRRPRSCRS